MKTNSKQRLFEMMNKVNPSFLIKENNDIDENYPLGAENDPNAPWNQNDDEDDDNLDDDDNND